MKRVLIALAGLFLMAVLALTWAFFHPHRLITRSNLEALLQRQQVIENWQLQHFELEQNRRSFSVRDYVLRLEQFCFEIQQPSFQVSACIDELNWPFTLDWSKGTQTLADSTLRLSLSKLLVAYSPGPSEESSESSPLDLKQLLSNVWRPELPHMQLEIDTLGFHQEDVSFHSPLTLLKDQDQLTVSLPPLEVALTRKQFSLKLLTRPDWPFVPETVELKDLSLRLDLTHAHALPLTFQAELQGLLTQFSVKLPDPLPLRPAALLAQLKEGHLKLELLKADFLGLPSEVRDRSLRFNGEVFFAGEQEDFPLELKADLSLSGLTGKLELNSRPTISKILAPEALDHLLLVTEVELLIEQIKKQSMGLIELPAPFNAMEGDLRIKVHGTPQDDVRVSLNTLAKLDLKSADQALKTDLAVNFLVPSKEQAIGPINSKLTLHQLNLKLPQLAKTTAPPQFLPDARILQERPPAPPPKKTSNTAPPFNLTFKTDAPITLDTQLIESPLQLLVDLKIKNSKLTKGRIELLPLKAEFFRRPIEITQLIVELREQATPFVQGRIFFRLPEYTVTLEMTGPSDQLQTHFSSVPLLPQDDIFAVLLFGRPMNDLDESARQDASQGARRISQGLLSLSTLYFFAGSPVESLGYNPDKAEVSAQFGISEKSSLRVSTAQDGTRGAGVRRSLGGGWSIDTSVEQNQTEGRSSQAVLLERVLAY